MHQPARLECLRQADHLHAGPCLPGQRGVRVIDAWAATPRPTRSTAFARARRTRRRLLRRRVPRRARASRYHGRRGVWPGTGRGPGPLRAHVGRFSLARAGDLPAQATALTACSALQPAEPTLSFHRGLAGFDSMIIRALDDWNATLRLRPDDAGTHFWRAHFLAGRGAKPMKTSPPPSDRARRASGFSGSPLAWRMARARLGRHRDAADDAEQALAFRRCRDNLVRRNLQPLRPRHERPRSARRETAGRYGTRSVTPSARGDRSRPRAQSGQRGAAPVGTSIRFGADAILKTFPRVDERE